MVKLWLECRKLHRSRGSKAYVFFNSWGHTPGPPSMHGFGTPQGPASYGPTRVSCKVSQQTRHADPMLGQLCPTVYDAEPTLAQQWVNVSCLRVVMIC